MSSPQMGDSPRAPHSQQVARVPDPAKISTNRGGQIPAVPIKPQGRVYALRGDLGSGSGFLPKPVRTNADYMAREKACALSAYVSTRCYDRGCVQIGRAHVSTPVTNAQHVCRFLLE